MKEDSGLVSEATYRVLKELTSRHIELPLEVQEQGAGAVSEHVIAALQELQAKYHYLPEHAMRQVAARLGVPLSQVYHVATFYSAFSLKPKGKHIVNVCLGTACHVKGAGLVMDRFKRELGIEQDETTKDGQFTLQGVRCIGCCSIAPAVMVDEETHAYVKQDGVPKLLEQYSKESGERG
ncbi:NADH-quinone oxidoreductase subunit NuoE [bacterium]|nr:NADH-quinone oxidoreductase subunit NuoE [bacterium]